MNVQQTGYQITICVYSHKIRMFLLSSVVNFINFHEHFSSLAHYLSAGNIPQGGQGVQPSLSGGGLT